MIGEKLGNYRIVAKIGQGGMGAVYRAEHEVMGRQAAIKVLRPELTTRADVVRRFFNEARATAGLQHPALVQIYDCGTHEPTGSAYLVMDFLEGESLGRRLDREGKLSVDAALDFARQTANGMAAAHRAGIIHRDLKPDNLFLVAHPGKSSDDVRILDFGVAKLGQASLDAPGTKTGALLGTPTFMAPEQCRGASDIDGRADIYSLGCILFAMVCGRPPFVQRQVGQLLAAHANDEPPSPRQFTETISDEVVREIQKALAKDPSRRHQTMDEFAAALEDPARGSARLRPPSRRDREAFKPAMTEVLSPGNRAPRPTSKAIAEPQVGLRSPSIVLPRPAPDESFSAPGATRVLPIYKPAPSPRKEKGGTTIGDSPVELDAATPSSGRRTLVAAAAAAVGLVGLVTLTLWNTLSSPQPLPVEHPSAQERPLPVEPAPAEPFEPPPPPPIVDTKPRPPEPVVAPLAAPRAAHPRFAPSHPKKLAFAPLPESTTAPVSDSVSISISNSGDELSVTVDGAAVPLPLRLPRDGKMHILRFVRPGQPVVIREIRADQDQAIKLGNPTAPILE